MSVTFRFHPVDRAAEYLALLRDGLDPDFPETRFRWLHAEGPWGPSRLAVCEANGRLVGGYAVTPRRGERDGRELWLGRDLDPVVHPDWRGRGLFGRLLEHAAAEPLPVALHYNFANPASAPGFRRHGWRDAGPIRDAAWQTSVTRPLSMELPLWLAGRLRPRRRSPVRELDRPAVERLLAAPPPPPAAPGRVRVVRSADYLAWRYLRHPWRTYRWFTAETEPPLTAVVSHHPERRRLLIVELLGGGERPDLGPLLQAWDTLFPRTWIALWSTTPRHLRRHLLVNPLRRGGGTFLVRPAAGEPPPSTLQPAGWYLTAGDLEIL